MYKNKKKEDRIKGILQIILIAFVFLVLLMPIKQAKAAKCDFEEDIRMQIYVPGITEKCTEQVLAKSGKQKTVERYYVSADLTQYVKKVYKFAVGLIAIIAVVMIMVGGLQWTFAAGNPGKIDNAKTTITSAVAGLVLVLSSYLILDFINPNLTDLKLTKPEDVAMIQQDVYFCNEIEYGDNTKDLQYRLADSYLRPHKLWASKNVMTKLDVCGTKYEIIDPSVSVSGNKKNTAFENDECYSSSCPEIDQFCYSALEPPFCYDVESFCNAKDDQDGETKKALDKNGDEYWQADRVSGCYQPDKYLQKQNLELVCGKRIDTWSGDECSIGVEVICPKGHSRVSCDVAGAKDVCFTKEDGVNKPNTFSDAGGEAPQFYNHRSINLVDHKRKKSSNFYNSKSNAKIYCVNEPVRGSTGINSVCCHKDGTSMSSKANFLLANKDLRGWLCLDYENQSDCNRHEHTPEGIDCYWWGGKCLRK